MAGVSRKALLDALTARLSTLGWLTVYQGEINGPVPVISVAGQPDPSGRVAPYAVLYPSPGTPTQDGRDLADSHRDLDWTVQVTVAAGYLADLMDTVDRVDDLLHEWAPVIEDVACNGLRPPFGYDPGPSRRDDTIEPPRHWAPLLYRLTATR